MNAHDPIHLEIDVRLTDDGWRWRLHLWLGNVDTRNEPPTRLVESDAHFGSKRLCYLAALARARAIT